MTQISDKHGRHSESGIALLIAILTLLLITAIGAGMIMLTNTETSTSANFRDEQTAFFSAKAGIEEVRDRLRPGASNSLSALLPGTLMSQSTDNCATPATCGVLYVTNPTGAEADTPWVTNGTAYPDDEVCSEAGNMGAAYACAGSPTVPLGNTWYATTTASASYAAAPVMAWKWTRINLKTNNTSSGTTSSSTVDGNATHQNYIVCWTGSTEIATPLAGSAAASCSAAGTGYLPVYVMTTLAVTPSGSRRMVQAEATANTLNLNLPGALTVDGPSLAASTLCGSGSTCNGSGAYITGNEPASCPSGGNVPAIAVGDATTQTNIATGIAANKSNIVGVGGSPSVGNASSALSNLNTVSEVEALVAQMTTLAGSNTCTSSCGSVNLGTAANPTITVVNNAGGSAFQLNSGTTGYGILIVTGTLDYVNVNSYQGIILMLGQAQFISSSSKDTTFTGALFMAQDRDLSTGALLPGPALGTGPVFNYHHGNASSADPSIQYNACVINQVESAAVSNYKVVAVREMMK